MALIGDTRNVAFAEERARPSLSAMCRSWFHMKSRATEQAAAEDTVNVKCPWLISPAWCYAMTTLDRLEEERLRC
jgi:hypothetical protein